MTAVEVPLRKEQWLIGWLSLDKYMLNTVMEAEREGFWRSGGRKFRGRLLLVQRGKEQCMKQGVDNQDHSLIFYTLISVRWEDLLFDFFLQMFFYVQFKEQLHVLFWRPGSVPVMLRNKSEHLPVCGLRQSRRYTTGQVRADHSGWSWSSWSTEN